MIGFLIGYLVYAVVAVFIMYRFQVAWRYLMHKTYYIKGRYNQTVKPLGVGDLMIIAFSVIPPVFLGFLVSALVTPACFGLDGKDYFWGFHHAKIGQNYHGDSV